MISKKKKAKQEPQVFNKPGSSVADKKRAIDVAIRSLKKKYGDDCFISSGDHVPVSGIPSGSILLDHTIGVGGLPIGRIVEIYGDPGSGKTSLCTLIAANAQDMFPNSFIGYVDVEHAVDPEYASQLGLDMDSVLFSQPDSAEEALDTVLSLTDSAACSVVILDSVGGLQTKLQLEKGMGEATMAEVARILSQSMPKISKSAKRTDTLIIFVNQLRSSLGDYGSPNITMGGKSLKFFASLRLEIKRVDILTQGEDAIGQTLRIKLAKNKVGRPFGKVEADLIFGKGFNNDLEVIQLCIAHGYITQGGAWFSLPSGESFQGKVKLAEYLADNPAELQDLKDKLFNKKEELPNCESEKQKRKEEEEAQNKEQVSKV